MRVSTPHIISLGVLVLILLIGGSILVFDWLWQDPLPIVSTANGEIRGNAFKSFKNKTFYAFQGIPYAEPPVGELRFAAPKPVSNWDGVLGDGNAKKICVQQKKELTDGEGEDCLYLHVYTPKLPSEDDKSKLPVIYWIHGGAFVEGSARYNLYGPQYLMDYDVILVTVQYRLGFLGFLSTEDESCPGNNGLKDQQLGLIWVQKNIEFFGGDPDKVTIYGESAGGASVSHQLLGCHAKGLFRGAIQDSGSSLGAWTFQQNPKGLAYKFGKYVNSSIEESNTSTSDLVSFFKTLDIKLIKEKASELLGGGVVGGFYKTFVGDVFAAVIEKEHDDAFITENAFVSFQSGNFARVPVLMGINSEEALFLVADRNFDDKMKELDEDPRVLVPPDMHITDETEKLAVGKAIKEYYIKGGEWKNNKGPALKYFGDGAFGRPCLKQAELISAYTDVYFYEFAYSGSLGIGKNFSRDDIKGVDNVVHAEELMYIFQDDRYQDAGHFTKEDLTNMDRLLTLWTNFVKDGNPTSSDFENIVWPSIKNSKKNKTPYLYIDEKLEVKYNLKKTMTDKYKELYDNYAKPPLNTY